MHFPRKLKQASFPIGSSPRSVEIMLIHANATMDKKGLAEGNKIGRKGPDLILLLKSEHWTYITFYLLHFYWMCIFIDSDLRTRPSPFVVTLIWRECQVKIFNLSFWDTEPGWTPVEHQIFIVLLSRHIIKWFSFVGAQHLGVGSIVKKSISVDVKSHLQLLLGRWAFVEAWDFSPGAFWVMWPVHASDATPFFFWSSRVLVNSCYFVLLESRGTEYWPTDQSKAFEWVTNSPFSPHQLFSEAEIETWVIEES